MFDQDRSPFESEPTSPCSAIDQSINSPQDDNQPIKFHVNRSNRPYADLMSRIAQAVDYEANLYKYDENEKSINQSINQSI